VIVHEEHASVGQRMLWLIERHGGRPGQLNYPLVLGLRGPVGQADLQRAVDTLVARHEALRTTFGRRQGLLTQLIHEPEPVPIDAVVIEPGSAAGLRPRISAEIATPIDPARSPLRVTLWTLGPAEHVLCINAHHLVTDAWSCRILVEELVLLLGGAPGLPRIGWQYRHYVQWQQRQTTAVRLKADREYWQQRLDGARPPALPPASPPPPGRSATAGEGGAAREGGEGTIEFDIGREPWERLQQFARAEHTTPFAVLLSIYYLLIRRETEDLDLAISSPFANRTRTEVMRTVGFFVNMLILRTGLRPGSRFTDLLRSTSTTVAEALEHQGFPYFLPPGQTRQPDARRVEDFVFQMLPGLPPATVVGELQVEVLPPMVASRFDLELTVIQRQDEGLRAVLQYAPDRIDQAVAQRLAAGCAELAVAVTTRPDLVI
jgi:hypothetical protein